MFRTELPLTPHSQQLPHSARVLTIGSCFSDSIGSRLTEFKVATMANPFGTVFNPISACKLLRAAAGEDMDWQQHLVEARGRWQSHDLHAEVGANSPVELLQHIQTLTREAGVFLATADAVVLTLGSAFAYRLKETDEIISNCHKLPAEKFEKELLAAEDIIAAVAETHAYLRRINPRLRFILTVSPVRHLKDTLVLNSASKAMLRVACHYLSELLPDVSYFPAYELLVDDLRDYRFYASDMLHPSDVAEHYIWERFTRTYFDAAFGRFKKEWEGLRQALGHRPLHAGAPEHRQFLESTLDRLRKLSSQADVRMELLHVERELAALPLPSPPVPPEIAEYDDDEERIDIGETATETAVTPVSVVPVASSEVKPITEVVPKRTALPELPSRSQASLLGNGAGLLLEIDEDAPEEDELDLIPADAGRIAEPEATSPDSAYEQAYTDSGAVMEEGDTDESGDANVTPDEAARRKKRRSRGGAKRTKRKHARLAAEAALGGVSTTDASSTTVSTPASESVTNHESTPEVAAHEEASAVVYVTEEELRQPRTSSETPTNVAVVDDNPAVSEASVTDKTADVPARRSRNNRRDKRERPARTGSRTSRPALYADTDDAPSAEAPAAPPLQVPAAAAPAEEATAPVPATSVPETVAATEVVTPLPKTASKPRSRKPTTTTPALSDEVPAVELAPTSSAPATVSEPVAPDTAVAKASARPRRKPTAKPTASEVATVAPVAQLPQPEPAAVPKAAPRKRPAAKSQTASTPEILPVAPASATPEPVVKKKPVARKKPAPTESTPAPAAPDTAAQVAIPAKPRSKAQAAVPPSPTVAPKRKAAPKGTTTQEQPVAPIRKPRPPRRKPTDDSPTPDID